MAFSILSIVLSFCANIYYLTSVIRGTTKPRITSWLIWSLLGFVSGTAALIEHQYPTSALLYAGFSSTFLVVIFGWKSADRIIDSIDKICFVGALVGLVFLIFFNSPAFATVAIIMTDFVASMPTLIHSWKKPSEETWVKFLLSFLAAACTLLVINNWRITAFAYPLYLLIINIVIFSVILLRSSQINKKR